MENNTSNQNRGLWRLICALFIAIVVVVVIGNVFRKEAVYQEPKAMPQQDTTKQKNAIPEEYELQLTEEEAAKLLKEEEELSKQSEAQLKKEKEEAAAQEVLPEETIIEEPKPEVNGNAPTENQTEKKEPAATESKPKKTEPLQSNVEPLD